MGCHLAKEFYCLKKKKLENFWAGSGREELGKLFNKQMTSLSEQVTRSPPLSSAPSSFFLSFILE